MAHRHLDPRLLEKLLQGAISPAEARELASHLMESCPDCACAAETGGATSPETGLGASRTVPPVSASAEGQEEPAADISFERVRERLAGTIEMVFRQRDEAPALLQELDRHPLERQRILIRNNARFQTLPLGELLLERAWSAGLEEPAAGEALAELAAELLDQIDPEAFGEEVLNDLRARSWAFRGNLLRLASDFRAAARAFHRAEALLADGTGDLLEQARLLGLRATLANARSRCDEARNLLQRALRIYLAIEEDHLVGRTLIQLGVVATQEGRYEDAMRLYEKGRESIDAEQEPRLLNVAHHNLVESLIQLGRFQEAAAQLPTLRRVTAEHATRLDLLRLRWMEGFIQRGLGHDSRAEAAFLEVRKGFVEQGTAYDAAAVSLDLAGLYLRQGRTAEIRELVSEMMPIFRSRGVHQDAMTAFLLLQRAVELESLTLRTIEEVAEVIRRSQGKPLARLEEPS